MYMKTETETQKSKRKEKEQCELTRLKKLMDQPSRMHAFWFLLIILTIIYIADEISSSITGVMKPFMIFDLFQVPNADTTSTQYESAISVMAIATIPSYIIMIVNPLYKTLADRWGRKMFLVINTFGMGIGMLICMVAPNPYIFILGSCILGFFTPNDMQVIYLMETAPKQHRAKLCSITKGIGLLSVSLIGVLRAIFYDPEDLSTWRLVYIVPVLITLIVACVAFFFTKETPVFLKKRVEYLSKTDEERAAEAAQSTSGEEKASLSVALKYIFKTKQCRMILIVLLIFSVAIGMSGYATEILLASGHMTNDNMNLYYILQPIIYAVCAIFSGFITDAIGRKNAGLLFGIVAAVSMAVFVFGAKAGIGPVALACAYGLMYGGMWSFSDLMFLTLPAESAPTHIRASVMSLLSYAYVTSMISTILVGVFYQHIGSENIGVFQLIFFAPIMIFSAVFLKVTVKETNGRDLTKVGGDDEE